MSWQISGYEWSPSGFAQVISPPTAKAIADANVSAGATSTLDGTGSTAGDNQIASYSWVQTGGSPTVTLQNANTATPTYPIPLVTGPNALTFTLTVTDSEGLSSTDTVTQTIRDTTAPAITPIGGDITLTVGQQYTPGSWSVTDNVDPDPNVEITSNWTDAVGSYTETCTVTDAAGNVTTETRAILVIAAPTGAELMRALEIRKFEMVFDGELQVFEGYANREEIGFRPDKEDGLPIRNGMIDWSDERWDRIEVIGGADSKISTKDIPNSIYGEWLRLRLGDLKLDNTATLKLTFVAYIKGIELGFVVMANHQIPLAEAAVFKKRYQGA